MRPFLRPLVFSLAAGTAVACAALHAQQAAAAPGAAEDAPGVTAGARGGFTGLKPPVLGGPGLTVQQDDERLLGAVRDYDAPSAAPPDGDPDAPARGVGRRPAALKATVSRTADLYTGEAAATAAQRTYGMPASWTGGAARPVYRSPW